MTWRGALRTLGWAALIWACAVGIMVGIMLAAFVAAAVASALGFI